MLESSEVQSSFRVRTMPALCVTLACLAHIAGCGGGSSEGGKESAIAPTVGAQPVDAAVYSGGRVTFTATARGNPTPTVQWQRSDAGGAAWVDVAGAAAETLELASTQLPDSGSLFRAIFTNASGTTTTRAATLTIKTATLTLLAGSDGSPGYVDGPVSAARFSGSRGVAVGQGGIVYVADTFNHVIRRVTPDGVVSTLAGLAGSAGSDDGTGSAARFREPICIAVDAAGTLYVGDNGNSTIRKITAAGVVTTLAGSAGSTGSSDGAGAAARFNGPQGIAIDAAANVYVADSANHTIRKITPSGAVSTLAGAAGLSGHADAASAAARFLSPWGVAVDGAGNAYVAEDNHTIRKVTPAGVVSTLAGQAGVGGSADGTGTAARFLRPIGIAADGAGNLYVGDFGNSTVRRITPAGTVTTLAGAAGKLGDTEGTGAQASFNRPFGVALDAAGSVYVADGFNSKIRKITLAGAVGTHAGPASAIGSFDGAGSSARFSSPYGVAADGSGIVYVADYLNNTIRRVTPAGAVSTLAGVAGVSGSADGVGTAARFSGPIGVATDAAGNVYVADQNNSTIRKVTPAGAVSTLAGVAGSRGNADGAGATARFREPTGIAVDTAGDVYVADLNNQSIRKITPAGLVSTLATGFAQTRSVAVDAGGNVYVLEGSPAIRRVSPSGVVSTLAGSTTEMGYQDGAAAAARFTVMNSVAVDAAGNVFVTDQGVGSNPYSVVRKITPGGLVTTVAGRPDDIRGLQVGANGTLFQAQGVAVTASNQLLLTSRNAVLLASWPP